MKLEKEFNILFSREVNNIAQSYMDFLLDNFKNEGSNESNFVKWKEKSEKTKKVYKSKGWVTNITGVRKGDLKRSFVFNVDNTGRGWILNYKNNQIYASYFNENRPILYVNENFLNKEIENGIENVTDKLLNYIKNKIEK